MLSNFFDSIRNRDFNIFCQQLDSCDDWRTTLNSDRYANWFSARGASLLQITSFLRPEFAQELVRRGVPVDLHSACALGDTQRIERLLSANPQLMDEQFDSYYPIQFALGQPAVLRRLLELGDDANRPLLRVAWFEWEDTAVERGVASWRPIHMLALGRNYKQLSESANILREHGADLRSIASPLGDAGIHLAAIYNQTELIEWFVINGVPIDLGTGANHPDCDLSELFEVEPFAPFTNSTDKTPLMLALGEGQKDAARRLIELGANVQHTDSEGFSPLHYAAAPFWNENLELIDLLLAYGADPNALDAQQRRPVDVAHSRGYAASSKRLAR